MRILARQKPLYRLTLAFLSISFAWVFFANAQVSTTSRGARSFTSRPPRIL